MSHTKKLFLVDGSSYFFRAFYAIQHLSSSTGIPTNATLGFTNMLQRVVQEHQPEYLVMVYDAKGPTFRKEIYADYKANRGEMPEELAEQIPYIKDVVKGFRVFSLERPGFEADDIIATIVKRFQEQKDLEITIVSGDKDLMQLVTDKVTMLDTMRDKRYGVAEVKEKFGVEPKQLLDVLAIAGDTSDNIPGIPGMGVKTAANLINDYKDLENLLAHADEVKGKSKQEKLKNFAAQARLSQKLVRLKDDLQLDCDLNDFKVIDPDYSILKGIFEKLELRNLLKKIQNDNGSSGEEEGNLELSGQLSRDGYRLITNQNDLEKFVKNIKEKNPLLSIDLETTSLTPMEANIVGVSLCVEAGKAIYIPVGHINTNEKQLSRDQVLQTLKPLIEDETLAKIGQNIKYDDVVLRNHGITLRGLAFDTMLASYLLDAQLRGAHNLDALCSRYLNHRCISYKEVTEAIKSKNFAEVPLDKALAYAGEDADMVLQLREPLAKRLKEENLERLFYDCELPLSSILAEMEFIGVRINQKQLNKLSEEFEEQITGLTEQIYALAGEEFLISSTKQLQRILFDKLGLPTGKKTKTGFSTDTEVLSDLALNHEIPRYILRFRMLSKLKSTYVDALPALVNEKTGRIHTQYNQAIAATGRLTSSHPNLQNIPVKGAEGQEIRRAFVADKGMVMLDADYSQIELRLFAHFSEDETLMRAYTENVDVHSLTAQGIFNCSLDEVDDERRRQAKTVNFGILYGMSDFGLGKQLGIPRHEAGRFIQRYFEHFPGVRKFIDETIEEARKKGFVRTYLGRKRAVPDLNSKNFNIRKAAERVTASTPLQGSAADLIKIAMINVDRRLKKEGYKARMILQVHDELVFEVPDKEIKNVQKIVEEEMQGVWQLKVPLVVQSDTGNNWLEAH